MIYTVIAHCESTGQAYAGHFDAANEHEAMSLCAHGFDFDADWTIIGAIPGELQMIAPCEDSGKVACACDIPEPEYEAISRRNAG